MLRPSSTLANLARLGLGLIASASVTLGCSGSTDTSIQGPGSHAAPTPFERSPIVFGAYDPPGTMFVKLEDGTPELVNDNYDFNPMLLSPSRKRVVQVTLGPHGEPYSQVEIHEVMPNSPLLGNFQVPGQLLGWAGEATLLFATFGTGGLSRVSLGGSPRHTTQPGENQDRRR